MKILALDTSASSIGMGYFDGNNYFEEISTPDPKSHNKHLLGLLDRFLHEHGATINDMDCFAVVTGPGSFTGIRIGVATINAFAMATKKPVIELTSLEVVRQEGDNVVLLDCKHNNYYVAIFRGQETEYCCLKKDQVDKIDLPKTLLEGTHPKMILLCAKKKWEKGETCKRAKPFYIKSSSAETGE